MDLIESHVDVNSSDFKENKAHHQSLREELFSRLNAIKLGGGPRSC